MFIFFLLLFTLFSLFHILIGAAILYHLKKYRTESDLSKRVAIFYIVISILVLGTAFFILVNTSWEEFSSPFFLTDYDHQS